MADEIVVIRSYATLQENDGSVVRSTDALRACHGIFYSDFELGTYLADDVRYDASLSAKLVNSGPMKLEFDTDENVLFVVTQFSFSAALSDREIQQLIRFTSGQWVDGIGASFSEEFFQDQHMQFEAVSDEVFLDVHAVLMNGDRVALVV